jgi:hypothetical protein
MAQSNWEADKMYDLLITYYYCSCCCLCMIFNFYDNGFVIFGLILLGLMFIYMIT